MKFNKDFFKKNKWYIFWITLFLFIYIFLALNIKNLEIISSFPAIKVSNHNTSSDLYIKSDYEEINIKSKTWDNINGLYVKSDIENAKTVYFFHGNSWDLSYFYNHINYINELWYNVISYDYPWYGKSGWYPDDESVFSFSQDFYDYIKSIHNFSSEDIIIWWYSIWTAVATDFASKNDFDKLILFSPLSSRYDMSKYYFWIKLQKLFFRKNSFDTKSKLSTISNDLLIIHWNEDKIVPFYQWKDIFNNSSSNNKFFVELDKVGHNQIIESNWKALKNIINQFISWDKNKHFLRNYLNINSENIVELENELLIDLYTDSSIQKFVTSNLSFDDKSYVPENLVSISGEYVFDAKWWYQLLRQEAKVNLDLLAEEFYKEFSVKLSVVSAYRSYTYQKGIKDRGCPDNLCAKAWFSEHQSGLAVDLFEASTNAQWKNNYTLNKYYNWLKDNAHYFGFHNTYQYWLDIDWYEIEPWHWRYLWEEFATYLYENNITIAQYYESQKNRE